MSTKTKPPAGDYGRDKDYWIDEEFGFPSLASLRKRIAAFRKNSNHRSARVTATQLDDVLSLHPPEEWPEDILAYKADLEAGRGPSSKGREPKDVWDEQMFSFFYEEYQDRRRVLGNMRKQGTLAAWCAERNRDAKWSVGDLAIDSVLREFQFPGSRGLPCAPRLRNIFSELKKAKT